MSTLLYIQGISLHLLPVEQHEQCPLHSLPGEQHVKQHCPVHGLAGCPSQVAQAAWKIPISEAQSNKIDSDYTISLITFPDYVPTWLVGLLFVVSRLDR
jgi:hypothetical protein